MKINALTFDNSRALFNEFMVCIAASLLLALSAQVFVTLPFSPVPFTFQTMVLGFIACLLGPQRALMAVTAYFLEGLSGLPVFAQGCAGFVQFLGPDGGYLVGFLIMSYVVGRLFAAKPECGPLLAFVYLCAGYAIILACGWAWLSVLVGPVHAMVMGVLPFIINEMLKAVMIVATLPAIRRYLA
ncbi:MAG: biotin transporter BioY [Chlamydiales bacterium]|nr:biotin transporter BioY [Chlamydiales bacterium]